VSKFLLSLTSHLTPSCGWFLAGEGRFSLFIILSHDCLRFRRLLLHLLIPFLLRVLRCSPQLEPKLLLETVICLLTLMPIVEDMVSFVARVNLTSTSTAAKEIIQFTHVGSCITNLHRQLELCVYLMAVSPLPLFYPSPVRRILFLCLPLLIILLLCKTEYDYDSEGGISFYFSYSESPWFIWIFLV